MNIKKIEWQSAPKLKRNQLCGNFLFCISLKHDASSTQTDSKKSNHKHCCYTLSKQGKYRQYLLYGVKKQFVPTTSLILYGLINSGYFSELLAFLDTAYENTGDAQGEDRFFPQFNDCRCLHLSYRQLEQTFIMKFLAGEREGGFSAFCHFIRQQESYLLARYLIENYSACDKISELSERYGLSYSYFRKKTQLFFGDTAKSKIQAWRLAKTTLELLGSSESITRIAMNNGFASSSHIHQVILSSIGMTPSSLRKVNERL